MNIKTNLFEDCVNYFDTTMNQNTLHSEIILNLIVIIVSLFSFHLFFKYLNE